MTLKYSAMVFTAMYCGELIELNTHPYKTSDELKNVDFIPVTSGGYMDQEIEYGRYAETYFAVYMYSSSGLDKMDSYNVIMTTEMYLNTIEAVGPEISKNIVRILSYMISKKIIKMISFTEFKMIYETQLLVMDR
jgi:hypothetical protein